MKIDNLVNVSGKNIILSIVTVTFNDSKHLENTILNVVSNKSDFVEYIIVDGGSTDDSISIIKKYEDNIDLWISEKDEGIYDAMNKGAEISNGKYLMFLNAGDYITEEFVDSFNKGLIYNLVNSDMVVYDVIYGDVILVDDILTLRYNKAGRINRLYYKIPFCHQSTLVLKSEFKQFRFDEKLRIGADYKLFRELFLAKKNFRYVRIPFVKYNLQGISSASPLKLLKEYKNIIKEKKSKYNIIAVTITNIKILKHAIFTRNK